MHRAKGHAYLSPIVLIEMQWRRSPEISEGKVFFDCGIESRPVSKLGNSAVLGRHLIVYVAVVDHVLEIFDRRPGKHEDIVSGTSLDFSPSGGSDLFNGDFVDGYRRIMQLAPVPGCALKPEVKLWHQMRPFRDLERFLAGENATREVEEWSESGRASRPADEITARNLFSFGARHSDYPIAREAKTSPWQRECTARAREVSRASVTASRQRGNYA